MPIFVKPPVLLIVPENVAAVSLLLPTVSAFVPSVTLPEPVKPSIVSLTATS